MVSGETNSSGEMTELTHVRREQHWGHSRLLSRSGRGQLCLKTESQAERHTGDCWHTLETWATSVAHNSFFMYTFFPLVNPRKLEHGLRKLQNWTCKGKGLPGSLLLSTLSGPGPLSLSNEER